MFHLTRHRVRTRTADSRGSRVLPTEPPATHGEADADQPRSRSLTSQRSQRVLAVASAVVVAVTEARTANAHPSRSSLCNAPRQDHTSNSHTTTMHSAFPT